MWHGVKRPLDGEKVRHRRDTSGALCRHAPVGFTHDGAPVEMELVVWPKLGTVMADWLHVHFQERKEEQKPRDWWAYWHQVSARFGCFMESVSLDVCAGSRLRPCRLLWRKKREKKNPATQNDCLKSYFQQNADQRSVRTKMKEWKKRKKQRKLFVNHCN